MMRQNMQPIFILHNLTMTRACLMRVDMDRLLMLGGSANPTAKIEYNIASDTWSTLPDLPFRLQNGACLTTDMPGKFWKVIDVFSLSQIVFYSADDCFDYGRGFGKSNPGFLKFISGMVSAEECQLSCQVHFVPRIG